MAEIDGKNGAPTKPAAGVTPAGANGDGGGNGKRKNVSGVCWKAAK